MTNDVEEYAGQVHRRDAKRLVRFIAIAAFVVVVVAICVDNRDDVRLGYVFGETSAPLWLVLVAAAVVGVVLGWLVRLRRRHDRD
jgi:uncharacterized integral membrane protein